MHSNKSKSLLKAQETATCQKPIAFIENKPMDFEAIAKLLEESQKRNHWANYGPATQYLEEFLAQKLELPANKSVVMCKSGTAALHTLVQLEELKAGKKLNWVISSFGFIASNVGCLSDATIIDCDKTGMLSLEELKALPVDSWDGIVITNIFGLCQDISAYEALCQSLNKKLIVDNAVGLFASWRHPKSPHEAISFHQTKPWGVGEGGCMIVETEDAVLIRDVIAFGRGRPTHQRIYYSNEKMADINAAAIMAWMQKMFEWYPVYVEQAERVSKIAESVGFIVLKELEPNKPYGNVPLIAEQEVHTDSLKNELITCMKYYSPLATTTNSQEIFNRIINIPSHQELRTLSDKQIGQVLCKIQR